MRKDVFGLSDVEYYSLGIRWLPGNPSLVFGYRDSVGKNDSVLLVVSPSVNLTASVWHHVGVAVSPHSPNLQFYVDGIVVATSDLQNGKIETGVGSLMVGDAFDGLLQDVRIYTRLLTASEMKQLAAGVIYLSNAHILPHCLCTTNEPLVSLMDDRFCQSQNGRFKAER